MHLASSLVVWNDVAHAYSFRWGEVTFQKVSTQRKRSYEFPFPNDQNAWAPLGRLIRGMWQRLGTIRHKSTNLGHPYLVDVKAQRLKFISVPG